MLPPVLNSLATEHYRQQQQTARAIATLTERAWRGRPRKDLWRWWDEQAPALAEKITAAQRVNATASARYTDAVASVQGAAPVARVNAPALTSPPDEVAEWLRVGPRAFFHALATGAPELHANRVSTAALVRVSSTLVQDAGREAGGVATAGNPGLTGYYRKLGLPACPRCGVLAGKWFAWNADFDRHPQCDCTAVPAADHIDGAATDVDAAIRSGNIRGLSEADRRAIVDDGADPSQVINAHRKGATQTTKMYGSRVQVTTEGTTVRGLAGQRLGTLQKVEGQTLRRSGKFRLTPSMIYKAADGDRDHARRLLHKHGYLL